MAGFFNDRRGIAAIDYLFVATLAYAVRDLAAIYGEAAGLIIRHGLRIG
jgi:hypothetical protein